MINDDIDQIIAQGEERTAALNSKYEGLNFDDLNNFKSDSTLQQWEGEDFKGGVCCSCKPLFFVPVSNVVGAAQSTHTEPALVIQAGTQAELFCGQLLQGDDACWTFEQGESS